MCHFGTRSIKALHLDPLGCAREWSQSLARHSRRARVAESRMGQRVPVPRFVDTRASTAVGISGPCGLRCTIQSEAVVCLPAECLPGVGQRPLQHGSLQAVSVYTASIPLLRSRGLGACRSRMLMGGMWNLMAAQGCQSLIRAAGAFALAFSGGLVLRKGVAGNLRPGGSSSFQVKEEYCPNGAWGPLLVSMFWRPFFENMCLSFLVEQHPLS